MNNKIKAIEKVKAIIEYLSPTKLQRLNALQLSTTAKNLLEIYDHKKNDTNINVNLNFGNMVKQALASANNVKKGDKKPIIEAEVVQDTQSSLNNQLESRNEIT